MANDTSDASTPLIGENQSHQLSVLTGEEDDSCAETASDLGPNYGSVDGQPRASFSEGASPMADKADKSAVKRKQYRDRRSSR